MTDAPPSELAEWEGRDTGDWAALWQVPRVEVHGELVSTNDRCRTLAAQGAPPFTVVLSESQTGGRGREGRAWASAPALGVWMSVLVRRAGTPARGLEPLLAGLAVVRGLASLVPDGRLGLKWPNDVLLDGRKVCGILCESGGATGLVAGIGINVRHRPGDFPPELAHRATSLELATGRAVDRTAVAGLVLRELRVLLREPADRLRGSLAESLAAVDLLAGRRVAVSTGLEGLAMGIAPDGALLVRGDDGAPIRIVAGSVRVLDASGLNRRNDSDPT